MESHLGFADEKTQGNVCKLKKVLYGGLTNLTRPRSLLATSRATWVILYLLGTTRAKSLFL